MKQLFYAFFCLLMLLSCARKDGLYEADKGWDCVYQGQEYRFRVETDGLYLYTSFDIGDGKKVTLHHSIKGTFLTDDSYLYLKFLCVNKDNEYVYMEGYEHMVINHHKPIQAITFDVGKDGHFGVFRKDHQSLVLLDRYLNR